MIWQEWIKGEDRGGDCIQQMARIEKHTTEKVNTIKMYLIVTKKCDLAPNDGLYYIHNDYIIITVKNPLPSELSERYESSV